MNYFLIGRPNVGKSSIFNILTLYNYSIIHPEEGTTRDWHKQLIEGTNIYIYDTPGTLINEKNKNNFLDSHVKEIINKKSLIFLYVIEYKNGFNNIDNLSINILRKFNKEIYLIINKSDNYKNFNDHDFVKYGIKNIFFISCSHKLGFENLQSKLKTNFDINKKNNNEFDFSISIFGKPNAGKSTFLNTLVGYNRSKTSPIAGTTSDYVIDYINYNNNLIQIIDTAGIGKKANIRYKSINYYSVKKTFENIYNIDASLVIIDAFDNLDKQDKRIIKLISDKSRSVILIFNKIDLIENNEEYKKQIISDIYHKLSEVKNIKIFFISALKKNDVQNIIKYLYNNILIKNFNISTSKLNKWLLLAVNQNHHPLIENKKVNFKYVVQVKQKPITIKIFCNYSSRLKSNYKKYLLNNFNYYFKILNQRTKIIYSSTKNPYV